MRPRGHSRSAFSVSGRRRRPCSCRPDTGTSTSRPTSGGSTT
jgi:hypothetical protein